MATRKLASRCPPFKSQTFLGVVIFDLRIGGRFICMLSRLYFPPQLKLNFLQLGRWLRQHDCSNMGATMQWLWEYISLQSRI